MGWFWALHFCQRVAEGAARKAGLRDRDQLRDKGHSLVVEPGRVLHAEHVDNYLAGTDDEGKALAK
eukprot:1016761-Lingulodinium_polyedra.AAC.1